MSYELSGLINDCHSMRLPAVREQRKEGQRERGEGREQRERDPMLRTSSRGY